MAVNQQVQKLNVAQKFIAAAKSLTDAYAAFIAANKVYVQAGLSFASGDFDNTALAYVNPSDMGTLITNLSVMQSWMDGASGNIMFKVNSGA